MSLPDLLRIGLCFSVGVEVGDIIDANNRFGNFINYPLPL